MRSRHWPTSRRCFVILRASFHSPACSHLQLYACTTRYDCEEPQCDDWRNSSSGFLLAEDAEGRIGNRLMENNKSHSRLWGPHSYSWWSTQRHYVSFLCWMKVLNEHNKSLAVKLCQRLSSSAALPSTYPNCCHLFFSSTFPPSCSPAVILTCIRVCFSTSFSIPVL